MQQVALQFRTADMRNHVLPSTLGEIHSENEPGFFGVLINNFKYARVRAMLRGIPHKVDANFDINEGPRYQVRFGADW